MLIKDLLLEYLDGKHNAIQVIRQLSGMFDPRNAVNILATINQVTRVEQGDLEKDLLRSMLKEGT